MLLGIAAKLSNDLLSIFENNSLLLMHMSICGIQLHSQKLPFLLSQFSRASLGWLLGLLMYSFLFIWRSQWFLKTSEKNTLFSFKPKTQNLQVLQYLYSFNIFLRLF